MEKWGDTFKFELEGDNDKERILEFSPKTYIKGLSKAVEQINDFYSEFDKQEEWYMNNRTALHINIGTTSKSKWNPIKGMLMMSDYDRENRDVIPYVFKNIEWRSLSRFSGSLIDTVMDDLKNNNLYYNDGVPTDRSSEKIKLEIEQLQKELKRKSSNKEEINNKIDNLKRNLWNLEFRKKENIIKNKEEFLSNIKLDMSSVSEFEDVINKFLIKSNSDYYQKEFGLKLTEIKNNYVEFRHIGSRTDGKFGGISKEVFLDKLYYFSYIVYNMTNDDFKRKSYLNKLYKFVEKLKEVIK